MKQEPKKQEAPAPVKHLPVKESSGDKAFDNAIDMLLKKPAHIAPAK